METIFEIIEETGFEPLPITVKQVLINAKLDFYHQDPFDRIIIAQSMTENMTIISKDNQFRKYSIPVVWN